MIKKFKRNLKDVYVISKQALKTELKGSGKEFFKKIGLKKVRYKKKPLSKIKTEMFGKKLNLKELYN